MCHMTFYNKKLKKEKRFFIAIRCIERKDEKRGLNMASNIELFLTYDSVWES